MDPKNFRSLVFLSAQRGPAPQFHPSEAHENRPGRDPPGQIRGKIATCSDFLQAKWGPQDWFIGGLTMVYGR